MGGREKGEGGGRGRGNRKRGGNGDETPKSGDARK